MDPLILLYIREVFKQVHRKFHWFLICASIISFAILGAGMLYEPKYETSMTIYADTQNVIKPLLEGRASVTTPKKDRIRIVREVMFAPRLLEQVIKSSFSGATFITGSEEMEEALADLRNEASITAPASNYISVSFSHEQPGVSFGVVNKLTNLFIEESARNKRAESKNAYTFIDEQVKTYKNQLVDAENKLKSFEAANIDGVESQVNSSIARLRNSIDEISIDIEAEQVRIAALVIQLADENRYASSDYNARVYRDRLAQLESRLNTLRLNYRDEHPDVIDIKLQIQDLKRTIVQVEETNQAVNLSSDDLTGNKKFNPIYDELSGQLSTARVELQTMKHRLVANENRLQERYQRRVRIASNQADLSELTRDYSVTKGIYEDLLERKERARISMTLDLSGQGVSYKVLEPAVYPVLPSGIRFLYFVIAGPIFGVLISLGVMTVLVLFDHRVQFAEQLNELFPGIVLAVIPATATNYQNWRLVTVSLITILATYSGAALTFHYI